MTSTISFNKNAAGANAALEVSRPYLVMALCCTAPYAPAQRFLLAPTREVTVGRGKRRDVEQREHTLAITVPDQWMSTAHARFGFAEGGWFVEDTDSKNGVAVNGQEVSRRPLRDGDLVEIGSTLFLFRNAPINISDPPHIVAKAGPTTDVLVTLNPLLARAFRNLEPIAASDVTVMIQGETGTGKELVARAIHERSGRPGKFVAVNCGALPRDLIESSLFGHKKGAFSGATSDHLGQVRAAEGGTLFLDEIAEMTPAAQVVLLRFLQEREVLPVGASTPMAVDVRVVAATHQSLPTLINAGAFRRDLYARVTGFTITLPPLCERREDIGVLVGNMVRALPDGGKDVRLHPDVGRALLAHAWPLNVRELEKTLRAALVQAEGAEVGVEHLPADIAQVLKSLVTNDEAAAETRKTLKERLRRLAGNVSAVAREMNTSRAQVRRLCQRFDVDPDEFRR